MLHVNYQTNKRKVAMPKTQKVFGSSAVAKPLPPTRRILIVKDLPAKDVSYHVNHLRRLWNQGLFPKPFYPTARRCSWFEDEIDQWLLDKQAEQQELDRRKEME
jgi:predicted DNA-binding transcriptional regulator AlpA